MKVWLVVGAVAVGAIGMWLVRERSIAEQKAKVAVLEAELDSVLTVVRQDSLMLDLREREHAAIRDSLEDVIGNVTELGESAAHEADSLSRALRESLSPELRPVLDSLVAARQRERESYEQRLILYRTTIASQDTLLDEYRRVNANLRDALRRSEELRGYWQDAAKRDPWEKPWFTLTTAAVAATASALAFR